MFINRYLIKFAQGCKKTVFFACFLQLIISLLGTCIFLCLAIVIQMLIYDKHLVFSVVWQPLALIAIMFVFRFLLADKKVEQANIGGCRIKEKLRKALIEKLFELGPAFTVKKRTGDIADTISNKVEWLSNYYVLYLPTAFTALVNSIIILLILLHIDLITALICFSVCVGMNVIPVVFYHIMRERGAKEWEAHSNYYSDCLDSIQGITTLKAFNADTQRRTYMHKKSDELRQKVMSQLKVTILQRGVLELLLRLGSAFSVTITVVRSINGAVDTQMLVYIFFLARACFAPMMNLSNAWHMGYRGITASSTIYELLNQKATLSLKYKSLSRKNIRDAVHCDIELRNVNFSYSNDDGNVLNDISFTIPRNTMTALIGTSGGGKSTIAHLLAGFYPVGCGEITIGEKVLNQSSVSEMQDLISAVWQDSHIFYGTIYDNILVGCPNASFDDVVNAAKKANLNDFISTLPDGYQTILGENGLRFSAGERQRIALARVFLRNSPILIFDEATSSLDRKNEAEIQESLYALKNRKTILAIAHRLSTIQQADQICIVEHGQIKEIGTHEQLLLKSPKYQRLVAKQLIS